jgi:hypothetical protein
VLRAGGDGLAIGDFRGLEVHVHVEQTLEAGHGVADMELAHAGE